jgi:hypothetical protein
MATFQRDDGVLLGMVWHLFQIKKVLGSRFVQHPWSSTPKSKECPGKANCQQHDDCRRGFARIVAVTLD